MINFIEKKPRDIKKLEAIQRNLEFLIPIPLARWRNLEGGIYMKNYRGLILEVNYKLRDNNITVVLSISFALALL